MQFILILVIIILDQMTKYMIYTNLDLYESIPIIENIFHITYTQNFGAAFSILQNQQILFIVISSIAVLIIFYILFSKRHLHKLLVYSLSLIAAGAIGNLIDRIRWGYVTDFLDFRVWPVFNVADMSIVAGTIILAYYVLLIEPKINTHK